MNHNKFSIGSAVFVKLKGYSAWPAKVEGIADETPNKVKYHVFFYGTNQIAVCKEEEMQSYLENRERLGKPKKAKGFNEAILQMDTELGLVEGLNLSDDSSDKVSEHSKESGLCESKISIDELVESGVTDTSGQDKTPSVSHKKIRACHSHNKIRACHSHNKIRACHSHKKVGIVEPYHLKLSILKIEFEMLEIHLAIQCSLGIKTADPDLCLHHLMKLSNLNINKLMIKKHPEIVYTLTKLQTYVGNTSNWNMTEDIKTKFLLKAKQIQVQARRLCDKMKNMFNVPVGISFLDYFEDQVDTLKKCTEGMSLDDFFRLIKDPTNTI